MVTLLWWLILCIWCDRDVPTLIHRLPWSTMTQWKPKQNYNHWRGCKTPNRKNLHLLLSSVHLIRLVLRHRLEYYLVILHSGSICWTVGSSMYTKARLPGTLARSTLKLACTDPALVTDGGEKHTISDMVLLVRVERPWFIDAFDCDGGWLLLQLWAH